MIAFVLGVLLGIVMGIAAVFLLALYGLDQWP